VRRFDVPHRAWLMLAGRATDTRAQPMRTNVP
jgi:hypothetical protein